MFTLPHFLHALADSSEVGKSKSPRRFVCIMLTTVRKTSTTVGNTQILSANIIPQTTKQEQNRNKNCLSSPGLHWCEIQQICNKGRCSQNRSFAGSYALGCVIPMLWDWPIRQFNSTSLSVQEKAVQDETLKSTRIRWGEEKGHILYQNIT